MDPRTPAGHDSVATACPDCGAEQRLPRLPAGTLAACLRCGKLLDRTDGRGIATGLVFALSALLLLVPGDLLPLMRASALGMTREATLISSVTALGADGWPLFAVMFAAFTIAFPLAWASLTTLVLGAVRLRRRPGWLGRAFRYAEALRVWAMPDVLLVAGFVIYARLAVQFRVELAAGGWCLIAAVVLIGVTSISLPRHDVWRLIMPDRPEPPDEPAVSCYVCNLIGGESARDRPCERCGHVLHVRRPDALSRTAALVVAGYVLYFPSYYYAMSSTIRPSGVEPHTIVDGIRRLAQAGYWYLAAIIIVVSVMIPLMKLVGASWLLVRAKHPSTRGLLLRTRVYRGIRHLGRWSNVDPFIVALNVSLLSFEGLVDVSAGNAALPFMLVTTVTMLAMRMFDSRLEWDAAAGAALAHRTWSSSP